MASPLVRDSSKTLATGPLAGQIQLMSSSLSRDADADADPDADTGVGADAATPEAPLLTPEAAPLAAVATPSGRVSTFAVVTGRVPAALGSVPGGTTRSTCPTSMTSGLSRPFHFTRSFQFWPFSSPMRMSVSPGLTV